MKGISLGLCALLAGMILGTGCGKKTEGGVLEKIKKEGKMIVYSNPEFPPYEYLGADGKITGAEIDLVNKIAERIGVKAEIVSSEFDSILMTVKTGKADMGASGFTINEERKKQVAFSDPFVVSVQYLIVPEKSDIKTVEDLAKKKVAGQQGTTGLLMIEDAITKGILKDTGTEYKVYNTAPDAFVAIKEGKVDAVVIDDLVAKSLTNSEPGFKCFEMLKKDGKGLGAPEEFGLMIAKGNEDFMQIVNAVIAEAKADGSLEAAFAKHREVTEKKKEQK